MTLFPAVSQSEYEEIAFPFDKDREKSVIPELIVYFFSWYLVQNSKLGTSHCMQNEIVYVV